MSPKQLPGAANIHQQLRQRRVVGIAFQALPDAENIGEMVPAPVIRRFLEGVKKNKRVEVPGFGIGTQNLENLVLLPVLVEQGK